MNRRTALQLVTLAALPSGSILGDNHCGTRPAEGNQEGNQEPYVLRFFTARENALLDAATEILIPADGHSPGASAARTSLFIDWMVSNSSAQVQDTWRSGLRLIEAGAKASSLAETVALAAKGENQPSSDIEKFFVLLKEMTIDGYYTSRIGIHQDLQYRGNEYLTEFPGCKHPEHG